MGPYLIRWNESNCLAEMQDKGFGILMSTARLLPLKSNAKVMFFRWNI